MITVGRLIGAIVLFIIVVAVALWYSQYTLGDRRAHLLWAGAVSILFVLISAGFISNYLAGNGSASGSASGL